jgi:hypothetical protein
MLASPRSPADGAGSISRASLLILRTAARIYKYRARKFGGFVAAGAQGHLKRSLLCALHPVGHDVLDAAESTFHL